MEKIANVSLMILASLWLASPGFAFEELTEPQTLIYDTDHLTNTDEGDVIRYHYAFDQTDNESTSDEVTLSIIKRRDETRRDISVNFLSGQTRIPLPDFENYRGNPVIIAMLEHLAQSMGFDTGGGALYFRNRIRDQLANESIQVMRKDDGRINGMSESIRLAEFTFKPLHNDPFVADKPELTESEITLTFSEDVPGYLVSISYVAGPESKPSAIKVLEYTGLQ